MANFVQIKKRSSYYVMYTLPVTSCSGGGKVTAAALISFFNDL